MKLLTISAFAAVALLGGVSGMVRTRSPSTHVQTAAMPTMQQLHRTAGVDKLPVEDFDDRSLVYPRDAKP